MAVKKDNMVMIPGTNYGIEVNNYDGYVSLIKINEGQQGVLYQQWCYLPAKGKNAGPSEKKVPLSVLIGKYENKQEMIECLRKIAKIVQDL